MPTIRTMTIQDIPLGMRLKEQAGWNQTEADWRRFLALQPDGSFVAEEGGTALGTTSTFIFGSVAWVAMVLVDQASRGRGLGTALMKHALAFLDARQIATVKLDATALGRPLYEKLGFVVESSLVRFEGQLPASSAGGSRVEMMPPEYLEELIDLDRQVTGADRRPLLTRLYQESPAAFRLARNDPADNLPASATGFLATRLGSRAVQIGPCLAAAGLGERLLADAFGRHAGQQVFLDIPTANQAATALAQRQGLTEQRSFFRMCRGQARPEQSHLLWASSGPEKG